MLRIWVSQLRLIPSGCRSFGSKPHVATATPTLLQTTVDWTSLPTVKLRGKRFLVGSDSPNVPEYLNPPRDGFPPVYVPAGGGETSSGEGEFSPEEWAAAARDVVGNVVEEGIGAVLFRGLPLHTANDFSRFVNNAGLQPMNYVGGAALRDNVTKNVDTASKEHPSISMELHNEMSYTHPFPEKILFYCLEPAESGKGGESVIADVREILRKLDPSVVDKFRTLGIRYHRYMPESSEAFHGFNSWKELFRTESRAEVEKYLTTRGMTWRWGGDGSLSWWYTLPALRKYKDEWLWFNQANVLSADYFTSHPDYDSTRPVPPHRSPFHTYYGDGSHIEPEVLQHIRDVTWQVAVGFQMKRRDVLVLNNMYIQHGRLGFTGTRKLLVSLSSKKTEDKI